MLIENFFDLVLILMPCHLFAYYFVQTILW